jgi:hypothetical protein
MGSDGSALPLILIELVLVGGGVLGFGLWQIRSVKRDRARAQAARAHAAAAQARPGDEAGAATAGEANARTSGTSGTAPPDSGAR